MRRIRDIALLAVLALGLALVTPGDLAFAAGGGGGGGNAKTSSSSSASALYAKAKAKVEAKDYSGAKPILEKIIAKNPRHADALNLMGYCSRKLGDKEGALEYYQKALKVNANHIGANEYLGELYLELNDLKKAEERLNVLRKVCKGCEEQRELEELIAEYKVKNGAS
jgi:tetratricopeptide (TPR) repeat protein